VFSSISGMGMSALIDLMVTGYYERAGTRKSADWGKNDRVEFEFALDGFSLSNLQH
jgi:hypothetical protein